MPRALSVAKKASTHKTQEESGGSSRGNFQEDEALSTSKTGKKRFYEEVAEDDEDECSPQQEGTGFDGEMQSMLESFGANVRRSLGSKKKRLDNITQQSLQSAYTKVDKMWKKHQTERDHLQDEFGKKLESVFDQWETDINKIKDQEEKMKVLIRQHQKLFQQSCIAMSQRLKNIKQHFEKYSKTMSELEQSNTEQQNSTRAELRKEMSMLYKKILMDNQNEEIANVKKTLQAMFFY